MTGLPHLVLPGRQAQLSPAARARTACEERPGSGSAGPCRGRSGTSPPAPVFTMTRTAGSSSSSRQAASSWSSMSASMALPDLGTVEDQASRPGLRRSTSKCRIGGSTARHLPPRSRRIGSGSRGRPRTRSPRMFLLISVVPPSIVLAPAAQHPPDLVGQRGGVVTQVPRPGGRRPCPAPTWPQAGCAGSAHPDGPCPPSSRDPEGAPARA